MDGTQAGRRAIIYTRVSTGKQAESGLSLDDQRQQCLAAVGARGWVVAGEATDQGLSGRRADNRPGLGAALDQLDAGEADALVVAKLDRLARSTVDLGQIMARAERHGWTLVLLDLNVDTSTPSGELVAVVIGAIARYESRLIGERTAMTHRQRKARGLRAGQAPILDDEVRHRVAEMRTEGKSFRAIADELNAGDVPTARGGRWHASTVRHVCRSVELDDTGDERVA